MLSGRRKLPAFFGFVLDRNNVVSYDECMNDADSIQTPKKQSYIGNLQATVKARQEQNEKLRAEMQSFREYLNSAKFAGENDWVRTWEPIEFMSRLNDILTLADDEAPITI